jgi:hypothetical protein
MWAGTIFRHLTIVLQFTGDIATIRRSTIYEVGVSPKMAELDGKFACA